MPRNRAVVRLVASDAAREGRFDSEELTQRSRSLTHNPPHSAMQVQFVEGADEFKLRYQSSTKELTITVTALKIRSINV